jgi:hypothetical protein
MHYANWYDMQQQAQPCSNLTSLTIKDSSMHKAPFMLPCWPKLQAKARPLEVQVLAVDHRTRSHVRQVQTFMVVTATLHSILQIQDWNTLVANIFASSLSLGFAALDSVA